MGRLKKNRPFVSIPEALQSTVSFSQLSEFLNDYVVGTSLTIEKKEGQFAGVAITTHFDGFVELGEGKFSPLVSGSKKRLRFLWMVPGSQ